MALTYNLISVIALTLCTYMCVTHGARGPYYMEDYCNDGDLFGELILVDDDGVLIQSQRGTLYEDLISCRVILYTDNGYVPLVTSQWIQLQVYTNDCIAVTDGRYGIESPQRYQHCTNDPLQYIATQRYLTIDFNSDLSGGLYGFQLLVTKNVTGYDLPCHRIQYGDFLCLGENQCYSKSSRCDSYSSCSYKTDDRDCDSCNDGFYCSISRQCVATHYLCDGNNDCDNGEDETQPECYPSIWWYWTGGQLAGIFIGFVIFLVIVIVIVAVVRKQCKK